MAVLKILHPNGGEVIVPPLTWISDISSVIQNGFTPVFVDIDPHSLAIDSKMTIAAITPQTRAVFLTHVQGFNGLTDELIEELDRRGILLIEDVCESHGATHNGRKLGTFGILSNFSFYYAHHMSTIEGGMICTDSVDLYQKLRMLRSHGLVRESSDQNLRNQYLASNPDLNPDFIFAYPAYNLRSTELNAIIGRSQLRRLDSNIQRRTQNFNKFLDCIDSNKFRTDFKIYGSSNYAFNLVTRERDFSLVDRLMKNMKEGGIEFRRGSAGGGNQLRQPYLRRLMPVDYFKQFPEVEHIHFFGFYIGNYPDLESEDIEKICGILNTA